MSFSLRVEEERYVPYSYVKKVLQDLINSGVSSTVIQRTFDYLNLVSKCSSEDSLAIMDEVKDIVQREDVRALIASLCPTTVEEVRAILILDSGKTYTTDQLQKIVDVVKSHMKS